MRWNLRDVNWKDKIVKCLNNKHHQRTKLNACTRANRRSTSIKVWTPVLQISLHTITSHILFKISLKIIQSRILTSLRNCRKQDSPNRKVRVIWRTQIFTSHSNLLQLRYRIRELFHRLNLVLLSLGSKRKPKNLSNQISRVATRRTTQFSRLARTSCSSCSWTTRPPEAPTSPKWQQKEVTKTCCSGSLCAWWTRCTGATSASTTSRW